MWCRGRVPSRASRLQADLQAGRAGCNTPAELHCRHEGWPCRWCGRTTPAVALQAEQSFAFSVEGALNRTMGHSLHVLTFLLRPVALMRPSSGRLPTCTSARPLLPVDDRFRLSPDRRPRDRRLRRGELVSGDGGAIPRISSSAPLPEAYRPRPTSAPDEDRTRDVSTGCAE